jgi:hypothetical protein
LVSNFYAFSSKLPSLTLRAILKVRLNLRWLARISLARVW